MTTINEALRKASDRLAATGVEAPRLEARRLLGNAMARNAVWVYQNLQQTLTENDASRLSALVERRATGEPLSYLIGNVEFYGRSFRVDQRVLIPRIETEELLELALSYARDRQRTRWPIRQLVDVGTGSGVLAVSLACELAGVSVVGIDRSLEALTVARINRDANRVGDRVALIQGDLLEGLRLSADLIVANLPYIPSQDLDNLAIEVRREPRIALDGGDDGLHLYRRLLVQAADILARPGMLIAEIGASQGEAAETLARLAFPEDAVRLDVDSFGRDRFLVVERLPDPRFSR